MTWNARKCCQQMFVIKCSEFNSLTHNGMFGYGGFGLESLILGLVLLMQTPATIL
jgi:hypothetical protein